MTDYLATWLNTDLDYSYAIGGIPFLLAPSQSNPYVRQTAQFRTDQVDTATNVGQQSLDGAWTFGQLSFHEGAGVEFADASDSDLDFTYLSSSLVDTVPGKAYPARDYADLSGTTWDSVLSLLPVVPSAANSMGAVLAGGNQVAVIDADTTTVLASETGTTPPNDTFMAVDPKNSWVFYTGDDSVKSLSPDVSTLYTLPTNVTGLWVVKQRLLIMTSDGNFYVEPENLGGSTVALTSADVWWALPAFYDTFTWHVADSPPGVFLAKDTTIYFTKGPADLGSGVATWAAPAIVAQLPENEMIQALAYYLGYLVVATTRGVRVVQVDSSGAVAYGPKIVDFDPSTSCTAIATLDTRVALIGIPAGANDPQLYLIDLATPKKDGTFAYTTDQAVHAGQTGVAEWNGELYLFGATTTQQGVAPSATTLTASITTSRIRMGVLADKAWTSLRVVLGAFSTGTINVEATTPKGSHSWTWDLGTGQEAGAYQDFDLTVLDAASDIQFTFGLVPASGTDLPTLGGFQVHCYPVPVRSRLIQVPIAIADWETTPSGARVGGDGQAWARLSALEEMEEAAGLVSYQDFRTGESGTAYIESVQFQSSVAPRVGVHPIDGVALVTLRTVL